MSETASELVWLAGLLHDLKITAPVPIPQHCDNCAAKHIAENPVFHNRTKHLDLDCHYARDRLLEGFLQTHHLRSSLQIADIITKPLGGQQHNHLISSWDLCIIHQVQLDGEGV